MTQELANIWSVLRAKPYKTDLKKVLITGASGKIGAETVKRFLSNGYFVVATFNARDNLITDLTGELIRLGLNENVCFIKADFSTPQTTEKFLDELLLSFKHFDVLVNNAGVSLLKQVQDVTMSEYDRVFNVNFRSAFMITQKLLPNMIENKFGKIINVSSVWGNVGASMETVYSASKSALIGFTKALAKEVALSNINVNCVCPGVIDTDMNSNFSDSEMQDIISDIPLSRLGKPSEIAEVIYFLADEKSSYITGQVITCDGGYTL